MSVDVYVGNINVQTLKWPSINLIFIAFMLDEIFKSIKIKICEKKTVQNIIIMKINIIIYIYIWPPAFFLKYAEL